ncbi:MAG: S9 family peptidase [candidate division Zixibacteria bacterium]|nr:S9 family peptidase [candidate division Zixibacteria bacterium]
MKRLLLTVAILSVTASALARPMTFDDLYGMPRSGDARISPDSKHFAFVLTTTDPKANTRESHIWIMNTDGTGARQLTQGTSGESSPRWSADGNSLLFLTSRKDETQVWRLPLEGGEAYLASSIPTGVSEFALSPNGGELLAVTRVFPDCTTDSCNRARAADQSKNPSAPRLIDHLLYRHYIRWDDGQVNRLVVQALDNGARHELSTGPYNAPTVVLGGGTDYAFSPDGAEVCFAMSTDSVPAIRVDNNLYTIPTSGGSPARITDLAGLEGDPIYSPDGRYISFLSARRPGYESDQRDIILYDRKTKAMTNLTDKFDRSVGEYQWAPNGEELYFLAIEHGFNMIWRIEVESHTIELLAGDAVYDGLQVSPDGDFLIVNRTVSTEPRELYRYDLGSGKLTRLTHFTEKITSELDLSLPQEFWFRGAQGDSVHGFLTLPPHFDSTRKYPFVLLIHGGPQWCWLGDFNYYGWNTQLVATQGYVVAQIDPHGSTGYGVEFQDYVSGNWGKGDYEDLMKGVDFLIKRHPVIDSARMGALGRSYGGFMTNWICGHTNRFRCLITIDGTYNHVSDYGATDELWFPEWEYKGTPWTNAAEYARSSPSTYAANFKTPTMVIHGQKDYRLDLSEGLQMFTALQRQGVPSQLLYFPDEGHNISKLPNLRWVYERQFEWLARWLKP